MSFNLLPKQKIAAIAIGAVVVLGVVLLVGFRPKLTALTGIKSEQKAEEEKLAQNKLKLARLDAIRQEAAEIEAKRISLKSRIPSEVELPSLIIELQKIAHESDVDVLEINFDDPEEQSGYDQIPFSIKADAGFYAIVDFLYRLEKMKREVIVDDIKLNPKEYPSISMDISARTFTVSDEVVSKQKTDNAADGQTGTAGSDQNQQAGQETNQAADQNSPAPPQ